MNSLQHLFMRKSLRTDTKTMVVYNSVINAQHCYWRQEKLQEVCNHLSTILFSQFDSSVHTAVHLHFHLQVIEYLESQ